MEIFYGVTHCVPSWLHGLWKRVFCKRGWHLLDEVVSVGEQGTEHYLVCDACDFEIPLGHKPNRRSSAS